MVIEVMPEEMLEKRLAKVKKKAKTNNIEARDDFINYWYSIFIKFMTHH